MDIIFDERVKSDDKIKEIVSGLLSDVSTLEKKYDIPVVIFQDGKSLCYYIKCSILATEASRLVDLNAKLDPGSSESFRANREILLKHNTYLRMKQDALSGREFNDIIVEYNLDYDRDKPLKVWGGQHRSHAILEAAKKSDRYHGFRIYFDLTKEQRTEVALISNTNINVSNDTFDRMLEETYFGNTLRNWCQEVQLLDKDEDFPDVGSKSEEITVKLARSFIINFYEGQKRSKKIDKDDIDKHVYEPYLATSGTDVDPKYEKMMKEPDVDLLKGTSLIQAGERFRVLHNAQKKAVANSPKIRNRKSFRNKALVASVLCGWSYVAGLLQNDSGRLQNHYKIPKITAKIPDPLNAAGMSGFHHDRDAPTYRGLGTRSVLKDMQRLAQVFLAKSLAPDQPINRELMNRAVSQVVGLLALKNGYSKNG